MRPILPAFDVSVRNLPPGSRSGKVPKIHRRQVSVSAFRAAIATARIVPFRLSARTAAILASAISSINLVYRLLGGYVESAPCMQTEVRERSNMTKCSNSARTPFIEVRHSPIHGHGVFAARRIRKGTSVLEYLGDRVTHAIANERYKDKDPKDNHTFLFTVDESIVIDAGVNGNEARYINHSCDPNCESGASNGRIFIEAIRTIRPGEELSYDYQIQRDSDDPPDIDEVYACRCGATNCRGTMLVPAKKPHTPARRSARRAAGTAGGRKRVERRVGMADRSLRRSR